MLPKSSGAVRLVFESTRIDFVGVAITRSELAALARSRAYDAVPSYDITSDVASLDQDAFLEALAGDEPALISAGAVRLDEPVADRAEGIKRLQALILQNVDAVRPAIRQRLGLPPLAQ